jgi:outer membrane protein assembly factor BamD (BamD/ComL family)
MRKYIYLLPLSLSVFIVSCSTDIDDAPPLVGSTQANSGDSGAAYQKALQADQAGNPKKAVKLYKAAADTYPSAKDSATARYRQAQIHEQLGEPLEAANAYNNFVVRYQGNSNYSKAIARQAAIANEAADGRIKSGLFGSSVEPKKSILLLEQVRNAAPQSTAAPLAQAKIAQVYLSNKNPVEAIAAYRKVVMDWPDSDEAAESQYQIGMILIQQAKKGNQDMGNLDRAREAFQDYLNRYSGKNRSVEVKYQLANLVAQDVQRSYDVAEFYRRKGDYESARFYYREVMKNQKSGSLYNLAKTQISTL